MSKVTIDEIKEQVNTLESREQLKLVEYIIQQLTNNDQVFKKDKSLLPALNEEPFVGMWEDREDMADSTAWVKSIRSNEWGR